MGTTTETWAPVPGFEARYEVSTHGRVKSLNYKRSGVPQVLVSPPGSAGYSEVNLRDGKRSSTRLVHRMVAQVFVTGYSPELDVNHKDGCKTNNYYQNLEWVTRKENLRHSRNILRNQPDRPVVVTNLSTGKSRVFATRAEACSVFELDPRSLRKVLKGQLRQTRGHAANYMKENYADSE